MHNGWKKQTLPRLSRTVFNLFLIPKKHCHLGTIATSCRTPILSHHRPLFPMGGRNAEILPFPHLFSQAKIFALCVFVFVSPSPPAPLWAEAGKPADKMPGHSPPPSKTEVYRVCIPAPHPEIHKMQILHNYKQYLLARPPPTEQGTEWCTEKRWWEAASPTLPSCTHAGCMCGLHLENYCIAYPRTVPSLLLLHWCVDLGGEMKKQPVLASCTCWVANICTGENAIKLLRLCLQALPCGGCKCASREWLVKMQFTITLPLIWRN